MWPGKNDGASWNSPWEFVAAPAGHVRMWRMTCFFFSFFPPCFPFFSHLLCMHVTMKLLQIQHEQGSKVRSHRNRHWGGRLGRCFVPFIQQYGCLCDDFFHNQSLCGIMFYDVVVTKYGIKCPTDSAWSWMWPGENARHMQKHIGVTRYLGKNILRWPDA